MLELEHLLGVLAAAGWATSLWLWRERDRLRYERDLERTRSEDRARTEAELRETFESVAGRALRTSNREFLQLARQTLAARETRSVAELEKRRKAVHRMVAPIDRALKRTQAELARVRRDGAGLRAQLETVAATNHALSRETQRLGRALRKPDVRGRYGEVQLERVVELSGMRPYCDFDAQAALRDGDGRMFRPDMVVRLPSGRVLAIDAKTNIEPYLAALEADTPEEADRLLGRFADGVAAEAERLSKREYGARLESSPELVVMFVPGDQFVDAALRHRPDLIEVAAERDVVIASPSTLIGLLRAVHAGWREERLSEGARELYRVGRELRERLLTTLSRAEELGQSLGASVRSYNRFVGSVHKRVLPALTRLERSGDYPAREHPTVEPVDDVVRPARSVARREDRRSGRRARTKAERPAVSADAARDPSEAPPDAPE